MLAVAARDRADGDKLLQPFRQHGAGDARNAAADVVETPTAAKQLAHDEQGPASAHDLMGARHRTELAIIAHAATLAWESRPGRSGFRTSLTQGPGLGIDDDTRHPASHRQHGAS